MHEASLFNGGTSSELSPSPDERSRQERVSSNKSLDWAGPKPQSSTQAHQLFTFQW